MIDIYICEDDPKELNYIEAAIKSFIAFDELDMRIAAASSDPHEILEKAQRASNCGLYFLDIDLKDPGTNGFLLAQNIRKIEPRCFIVFVTSHFELSYYTFQYKVEAMDYIVKDKPATVKNKLHECMLNAYEKHNGGIDTYRNTFTATMPDKQQISVRYEDIIAFETVPSTHKVILLEKNRRLEFPAQLNVIENQLNSDFFRCHRSAIINMRNIQEIDYTASTVTMSNHLVLALSLRKKAELRKRMKELARP